MSDNKRNVITSIVILSIIIYVISTTIDWMIIANWTDDGAGVPLYSHVLKCVFSILCVFLVFITGRDSLNNFDSIRIKIIFILLLSSQLLLLFDNRKTGLSLFFFIQVLLVHRNSFGFRNYFLRIFHVKDLFYIITVLTVSVCSVYYIIHYLYLPEISIPLMTDYIVYYVIFLGLSLFIALMVIKIRHFPRTNAFLIMSSMTALYICGIAIGYSLIVIEHYQLLVTYGLVWTLYGPGILTYALSGYSFSRQ